MGRLWSATAVVLIVAILSSSTVSASGRSLSQTTAVATATATATASATAVADGSGGPAVAVATADGSQGGDVEATSTAVARDGGTAISEVTAKGEEGSTVKANGTAVADDGATVITVLDVDAEAGATAIVDLFLEAEGDKVLAVSAWAKGLKDYKGQGNVIALALTKAFNDSEDTGLFATDALSIAFRDVINEHEDDPAYTAETIVSAVSPKDEGADYFGKMLIKLLNEDGCEKLQAVFLAAEALATEKNKDFAFMQAIKSSPEFVACVYNIDCVDDLAVCCDEDARQDRRCQCVGDDCQMKLFLGEPQMIWKCFKNVCVKGTKCSCPIST